MPLTATTADGERLQVWHLPRADAQAQVVYFHGNGGNLSIWSDALVGLSRQRYDVIAFDYRGYGLSTGRPSEEGLYRDVDAVIDLARPVAPPRSTAALLGPVSRHHDGRVCRRLRALQMESFWKQAFHRCARSRNQSSVVAAVVGVEHRFPTAEWMTKVRAPVLVLHGDADSVIPFRLGRRLHDAIPGPKRFVTIPGGDHNDVSPRSGEAYWDAIAEFVRSLPPLTTRLRRNDQHAPQFTAAEHANGHQLADPFLGQKTMKGVDVLDRLAAKSRRCRRPQTRRVGRRAFGDGRDVTA